MKRRTKEFMKERTNYFTTYFTYFIYFAAGK